MKSLIFVGLTLVAALIVAEGEVSISIPGTYKLETSVNFDEYMDELGVGFFLKMLAKTAKPTTIISKTGNNWEIKTTTTFTTTDIAFKLGEVFDESTADGRTCKSTITQEGETKLIHSQLCGGTIYEIIREFFSDQMVMTLKAGSVTSTRTYKRQ